MHTQFRYFKGRGVKVDKSAHNKRKIVRMVNHIRKNNNIIHEKI